MDSSVSADIFTGVPLPLASLRLLVPPFQLMAASVWQVLRKRDVANYWKVAEFVSLVTDAVPESLMNKHRTQLNLGLRARADDDDDRDSAVLSGERPTSEPEGTAPEPPAEVPQNVTQTNREDPGDRLTEVHGH